MRGGFARAWTPVATRQAESYFKRQAANYKPLTLILGAVAVEIKVYKSIPKSWSKRKREQAEQGLIAAAVKPDIDNYSKLVLDAMNGLFWRDDAQITELITRKYYAAMPRVEVKVEYE
jgi:Holliday junction resolvase RusA-like endonuclease